MSKYTAQQRATDWQFIWATAEGRRAIADLLTRCGMFAPTFEPSSAHVMAFNEGRRNAALDIVQALEISPEQFRKVSEAMKEVDNG